MMFACLLLLGQWIAFSTVLCVSGPEHVQVENFGAFCCAEQAPRAAGLFADTGRGCLGCTDVSMETPSAGSERAAAVASPARGIAAPARHTARELHRAPMPSATPATAVPLRC